MSITRFFDVPEIAERHRVSERTVRRAIDQGDLVPTRFGRRVLVAEADLLAYEHLNRGSQPLPQRVISRSNKS